MKTIPVQLAITALKSKILRTSLTILGISIGIAVVIAIMAAGRGLDFMVMSELDMYSPNMINVEIKVPNVSKTSNENAMGQASGITITTLKHSDLKDIAKHSNIDAAYGWITGQEIVSYQGQTKKVMLFGEGYQMPAVEKFELTEGRMYTKEEEDSLAQVVILGSKTKDQLFGDNLAVGKVVRIKGKPFKVVGVAAERGTAFFIDMDSVVIIPAKTMQKRILGIDHYSAIMARMKDRSLSAQTVEDLTWIMRENHNITDPNKDDFAVNTMEEASEMLGNVVSGIVFLLVALVCISLVVGGVGIMNIMYVSVSERTFEIGLRKALGAKKADIMWQFLAEAVVLTIIGSVVGVILGAILAFIIYFVAISYGLAWIFSIPISSIVLAISFSGFIGLLFGLYPAKKAAALDPITALRKE